MERSDVVTTCFIRSSRKRKPEVEFQSAVIQYLQVRYGPRVWVLNHRGGIGQRAGIPDLLCCVNGRFLALEVKSPSGKGRLGPKQKLELEAIRQAGGKVAVVASFEELEEVLRGFEKEGNPNPLRGKAK